MSNCKYRMIQLTNASVGAVAAATLIPLGLVTREITQSGNCTTTFAPATAGNNVVYIKEAGFYKITYTGTLTAGAAGNVVVNLQLNGVTIATATVTATAAGTVPVVITFVVRVCSNCAGNPLNLPAIIQLLNSGVALTGGAGNLVIERIYS